MSKKKKIQLLAILVYFLPASFFIAWLKLGYLWGVIIYLVIPSVYITLQKTSIFKKASLFSLLLSAPLVLVFNYMATVSKAWAEISTFNIKILGTFPIETFFWAFSITYLTIVFYEYFFDLDRIKTRFSNNLKYLITVLIVLVIVFGIIYIVNKNILIIKYFYIYFAVGLFIIPPLIVILMHPRLMNKFIYQGLFFLVLSIIYEITAVYVGHWFFPGNYVGFVQILNIKSPIEEYIWLTFCVPSTLAIYEIFADDEK